MQKSILRGCLYMSRANLRSGKNNECREEKAGENLRYFVFKKCHWSLVIVSFEKNKNNSIQMTLI